MQMGRWFGFRPGYRDLVRLFIGRTVGGPAGADYDMYKAFEAIVRDEQEFRNELTRFSGVNEKGETVGHSTRCAADGVSAAAVAQANGSKQDVQRRSGLSRHGW